VGNKKGFPQITGYRDLNHLGNFKYSHPKVIVFRINICSSPPPPEVTFGDSVTQTEDTAIVKEGAPLVIECTYETILFPYLLWYIQHPHKAPKLWLRDKTSGGGHDEGDKSRRGFSATPDKQGKTFHLKKSSSEQRDSAVYYCAMSDTVIAPSRVSGLLQTLLQRKVEVGSYENFPCRYFHPNH
uniref:Ig-like domain-containing protein n=1 Tax=Terrapene triunguis TaxID=2587831 RepID=A0A674J6Z0_9SAUR